MRCMACAGRHRVDAPGVRLDGELSGGSGGAGAEALDEGPNLVGHAGVWELVDDSLAEVGGGGPLAVLERGLEARAEGVARLGDDLACGFAEGSGLGLGEVGVEFLEACHGVVDAVVGGGVAEAVLEVGLVEGAGVVDAGAEAEDDGGVGEETGGACGLGMGLVPASLDDEGVDVGGGLTDVLLDGVEACAFDALAELLGVGAVAEAVGEFVDEDDGGVPVLVVDVLLDGVAEEGAFAGAVEDTSGVVGEGGLFAHGTDGVGEVGELLGGIGGRAGAEEACEREADGAEDEAEGACGDGGGSEGGVAGEPEC